MPLRLAGRGPAHGGAESVSSRGDEAPRDCSDLGEANGSRRSEHGGKVSGRGHAAHFKLAGSLAYVRRSDEGRGAWHVTGLCMSARVACRATRRAFAAVVVAGAFVLAIGAALKVLKHVDCEVSEARNLERQNDGDGLHDDEHRSPGASETRAQQRYAGPRP